MTSDQRSPTGRRVIVAPSGQSSWDGATASAFAAMPGSGAPLDEVVAWAVDVGARIPLPGSGRTLERWEFLASVAAHDVETSRILEPHLDAIAILVEARSEDVEHPRSPARGGTRSRADSGAESQVVETVERLLEATANGASWGVFASGGPASTLMATLSPTQDGDEWRLTGRKPWCSLGSVLSHALVTASTPSGGSRLFAVDLRQDGVDPHAGPWVARGLRNVVSAAIDFEAVRASPVGAEGWYLERPGFAWGGMGVAACWFGGAVGVARTVSASWRLRDPDAQGDAAAGAIDVLLQTSGAMLATAASLVDRRAAASPDAVGSEAERDAAPGAAARAAREVPHDTEGESVSVSPSILMKRVRSTVAPSAAAIVERVERVLGPGPSTTDEAFAKRVADLRLYLAQHHWERDDASLGRALRSMGRSPW